MTIGEIRDDEGLRAAESRKTQIESRMVDLGAKISTGEASDEEKVEHTRLGDELKGLTMRLETYLQGQGRNMQISLPVGTPVAPGTWNPVPSPTPSTAGPTSPPPSESTPVQERKRMSRLMAVLVIAGLILAMFFGYWFATEGYTLQSPIKEFQIEFQTPIVAPDSNDSSADSEGATPDEYSPPSGSGTNWICEGPAEVDQANNKVIHDEDLCIDPPT